MRDTLGSGLTGTAGWEPGPLYQEGEKDDKLEYELKVTTPYKRDWRTLWLLHRSDEYTILTNKETELADIMNMISSFEKFDCKIEVKEIG